MNIRKLGCYIASTFLSFTTSISFAASSSSNSSVSTTLISLIQAEAYTTQSGTTLEATTDVGGGSDVTNISTNDWLSYLGTNVNIPVSGTYQITYRVAGSGSFKFKESKETGNTNYDSVSVPSTGGGQNWIDITRTITLASGVHNFGIVATAGGFNINWFKIQSISGVPTSSSSSSLNSSFSSKASSKTSSSISQLSSSSKATSSASTSSSSSSKSSNASSSKKAQVLLFENFDNATLPTSLGIWGGNEQLVASPIESYGNSGKSLKYIYNAMPVPNGAQYPGGIFNLASYNTDHVYIRFRAKMPKYTHGIKFIKVFGQNSNGYANTTFGLDYTGIETGAGSMYAVSYGDGSSKDNDTANMIFFGGGPHYLGRATGLQGLNISTPQLKNFAAADWGTGWHKFEFYVKFNSGTTAQNENNDGEVVVRIDDKVYVNVKGLFNRHFTNKPIDRIEILGWSQNTWPEIFENGAWIRKEQPTPEFEVWYDNIEISLNGWGNNTI
ncbi:MAG: carbohydrate-binding protein [Gammaproteobacteria bacterium]|nr:MAG: carbohydrate-binding protein [Gammaproteobacteria bacterium]